MEIRSIDPQTANEADLHAWHELRCAAHASDSPRAPLPSKAETIGALLSDEDDRHTWFSWQAGRLTGGVTLSLFNYENGHFARLFGHVHPDYRRQGVGRALFGIAQQAAAAQKRNTLAAFYPTEGSAAEFFRSFGIQTILLEWIKSVLFAGDIDVSKFAYYAAGGGSSTNGVGIVRWVDHCPSELLETFAKSFDGMNDQPVGQLNWHDVHYTPERIRQWEKAIVDRGKRLYVVCARDQVTNGLAGFTSVTVDPQSPTAKTDNTTVLQPYRGRGLAIWLKATMMQWLMSDEPHVKQHETFNAHSNAPMRLINRKLGYEPVDNWTWWQQRMI